MLKTRLTAQEERQKRLETAKTWGPRIESLGLDQETFCKKSKMQPAHLSRLLSEYYTPTEKTVKRVESMFKRLEKRKKK